MSTPGKVLIWFAQKMPQVHSANSAECFICSFFRRWSASKSSSASSPKASNYSDEFSLSSMTSMQNSLADAETRNAFMSYKSRAQPSAFHPVPAGRGHVRSPGSVFQLNSLPSPLGAPGCSPALGSTSQPAALPLEEPQMFNSSRPEQLWQDGFH